MVLVVVRRRLDRVDGGQRCSREELENKSRSQGAIQNGHSDSPKASSPYSFLWVWWQRKIMLQLMMMMMSENHAMPVTGPWDRDSGYWRTFAQNSIYIGQPWPPKGEGVVLTIHQSGKKGGAGYGQTTRYSRWTWLDSRLTYSNRVSENYTIIL
jgi:hypothetical protein